MNYEHDKKEYADIDSILKEAGKYRVLTNREEERLLIKLAKSPFPKTSKKAMQKLLKHNLRLVIKMAKRYLGRGVEVNDLVQEGCIGFCHGVKLFNPNRIPAIKLSTYVTWWIRQKMGRCVENTSRLSKIPTNKLKEVNILNKFYRTFSEEEGRPPNSKELAKVMGKTVDYVESLGRLVYTHVSLDFNAGEENTLPMLEYLVDEKLLPEDKIETSSDKQYLDSMLERLNNEDAKFIKLKYGFLGDKERTDKQMANLLKIPVKEVKLTELRILGELKNMANLEKINTSILCDLVVLSPGDRDSLFFSIKQLTRWKTVKVLTLLKDYPTTLFSGIGQHLARTYAEELEKTGAVILVKPVEEA